MHFPHHSFHAPFVVLIPINSVLALTSLGLRWRRAAAAAAAATVGVVFGDVGWLTRRGHGCMRGRARYGHLSAHVAQVGEGPSSSALLKLPAAIATGQGRQDTALKVPRSPTDLTIAIFNPLEHRHGHGDRDLRARNLSGRNSGLRPKQRCFVEVQVPAVIHGPCTDKLCWTSIHLRSISLLRLSPVDHVPPWTRTRAPEAARADAARAPFRSSAAAEPW
jgi:hypothetical protein